MNFSYYNYIVIVELKDNFFFSGDIDANVPVTSSRYSISSLKLPIQTAWHPWYLDNEVRICITDLVWT